MIQINVFEVDPDLARIYLDDTEATYVGPGDAWEVSDDCSCFPTSSFHVPGYFGAVRWQTIEAMRAAVAEVGDPVAAMGSLGYPMEAP